VRTTSLMNTILSFHFFSIGGSEAFPPLRLA
jgi:hypothetical protein